jgi:hypothetical protein
LRAYVALNAVNVAVDYVELASNRTSLEIWEFLPILAILHLALVARLTVFSPRSKMKDDHLAYVSVALFGSLNTVYYKKVL